MTTAQFVAATMTHLATVERLTTDDTDRYSTPAWETLVDDQPCFLHTQNMFGQKGETAIDPPRTAVVDRMRVMLPKGTGIRGDDRFNSVTRNGVEILGGVARVVAELRDHHDHDEADLERVTGGA